MAVLNMCSFELCAMLRDRKRILERMQRLGTAEIKDITIEGDGFFKPDQSQRVQDLLKNAESAAKAAELADTYAPRKKPAFAFLAGREPVGAEYLKRLDAQSSELLQSAEQIIRLHANILAAKSENLQIETQEAALSAWLGLPFSQGFSGTGRTAVFVGSVNCLKSSDDLLASLLEVNPDLTRLHAEVVFSCPEQTNFYLVCLREDAAKAEDALRQIGFVRPPHIGDDSPPSDRLQALARKRAENDGLIKQYESGIKDIATLSPDFQHLEDYFSSNAEKYEALGRLAESRHAFIAKGYIPEKFAEKFKRELTEAFGAVIDVFPTPEEDEDAPIAIRNDPFSAPLEGVLEGYSLPGRGELDPTAFMSFFYYAMFGLMLSDAGYGLILAAVCGFCLLKFKNMDAGWRNNIKMFFFCGISTVFWGIVFSSYFGDVVDVVAMTFFGKTATIPPLWFAPLEDPMAMLIFCLAIGLLHLTFGYLMKFITCVKHGHILDGLFDALAPIFMIYPLIVILMETDMFYGLSGGFGIKLSLPQGVNAALAACSGVFMAVIVLTGGRESKSWFKRLLKGAYALYNAIAGWLSDVLSYSRLLALGLATGVIAQVFNQLGSLGGGGILGAIMFVVVFAVGQTLNFGINALGAYVHSNRLEYVEFFGKFYEGGGRKLKPLALHTKYIKIEEDL